MGARNNFICSKCGKYEVPHREGRSECKYCEGIYNKNWKQKTLKQSEYNKKITQKRCRIKELCVLYLGSECQYQPGCSSPNKEGAETCLGIFHFHHRDPTAKKFDIATYLKSHISVKASKSIKTLKTQYPELIEELDKCDLLCANCHHRLEYCDKCQRRVGQRILGQSE